MFTLLYYNLSPLWNQKQLIYGIDQTFFNAPLFLRVLYALLNK